QSGSNENTRRSTCGQPRGVRSRRKAEPSGVGCSHGKTKRRDKTRRWLKLNWIDLLGRGCFSGFRRHFVVMFGGVKTKDVLTLPRARVDRADVFAALHLPDCRNHAVLFDRVI